MSQRICGQFKDNGFGYCLNCQYYIEMHNAHPSDTYMRLLRVKLIFVQLNLMHLQNAGRLRGTLFDVPGDPAWLLWLLRWMQMSLRP